MAPITKGAALLTLAASFFAATALADKTQHSPLAGEDVSVGQGVVCDTVQQVERFTALIGESRDLEQALKTVNAEAEKPRACGMVLAAFLRGDEVGEIRSGAHTAKVVEITIVAVPRNNEWQFVTPLKQYTAFRTKGVDV